MQYPLPEKIGHPDLLVGRAKEFQEFQKWLNKIPNRLSKSRAILGRRKSGKTAFVQRLFNQLWSENGAVIPFYFDFAESKIWYPTLAINYYCAFASHYISFLERDEKLVCHPLSLAEIRKYGVTHSIKPLVDDVDFLVQGKEEGGSNDLMWQTACHAPHRYAAVLQTRFLVILDEFQNITEYVYRDEKCEGKPDETMAGSFHSLAESKIAPMLVTGSYVGWLTSIIGKYLEAGRLKHFRFSPYLTPDEGLQAVYQYAAFHQESVTNDTAVQINELCLSDPFFISCVIESNYAGKDLTTSEGVVNTVHYEISDRESELSKTWNEYLQLTLQRVNDRHAKSLLLYLSKHADRYWTPAELQEVLHLDLGVYDIQEQLIILSEADVIDRGSSDIQFRGLQDGTLNLILRDRFEEEINHFVPNLKQDFRAKIQQLTSDKRRLQGMLNHLSGQLAERLLANALRSRKRLALSDWFRYVTDTTRLNLVDVKERVVFQREDGKNLEIDVKAESSCGRVVLVEVKKTQTKIGRTALEEFLDKVQSYQKAFPTPQVLPAFFSVGGFTEDALEFGQAQGIGMTEQIEYI